MTTTDFFSFQIYVGFQLWENTEQLEKQEMGVDTLWQDYQAGPPIKFMTTIPGGVGLAKENVEQSEW